MRAALTIAGSDPGGGAGIQADLKTFAAHRVHGMAVVTALTAQSTLGVSGVHLPPAGFVAAELEAVLDDLRVDAVKTGMLGSAAIVEVVADALSSRRVERLVVDPVMVSKSGHRLLLPEAEEALSRRLLPLALLATPNLPEAEALASLEAGSVRDRAGMRDVARRLRDLGPRAVLVKGGHLGAGEPALDLLYDDAGFEEISAPRLETTCTHGTGCTLSAAIAANLARGLALRDAVARAKRYLTAAMAAGFRPGRGLGVLDHGVAPPG